MNYFRLSAYSHKMAVAFGTSDMILSEEQTEHINFRHVEVNDKRASKFKLADVENVGFRLKGGF